MKRITLALSVVAILATTSVAMSQSTSPSAITATGFEKVIPVTPASPDGQKACSVYAPNAWRTTTTVPVAWALSDCDAFAHALYGGNIWIQAFCFWSKDAPSTKSKMTGGKPWNLVTPPSSANVPDDNCGW